MISDTAYAILNWNRPIDKAMTELCAKEDLIVCTNVEANAVPGAHNIRAQAGVAASRNDILRKAREMGARWLFVMEDDLTVKNSAGFEKYKDLMSRYNIGITYYPYDKVNVVLGTIHNPCLIIKANSAGDEVYVSRNVCSILTCYDMSMIGDMLYDEDMLITEAEEFVHRCWTKKVIPFFGMHMDVPRSWEYFGRAGVKTERIKTNELVSMDKNMAIRKNMKIEFQSDATDLLIYIYEIEKKLGKI